MQTLLDFWLHPTAVFAANIMISLGAINAIYDQGLAIPEDISVIGIHDVFIASAFYPPLTTAKMPLYEMGKSQ